MTNFERVRAFHRAFGHPHPALPGDIPAERLALRRKLIGEELTEFNDAADSGDMTNIAKELADLLYVVYGTAVEYGIDIDAVFDIVHRSNMSKLGSDGQPIFRDDGKVLKGPDYWPAEPEVKRALEAMP